MKSRNPVSVGALKREWFAGLDMMDMGAALGGLASSTMLPGMIIKDTDGTKKFLKVILAFAAAAGAGFVFRNVSPAAGKYAVAGGVAGALAQVLSTFTSVKLVPSIGQSRLLPAPRFSRGIGESRAAAFSVEEVGQGSVT